jgi:hypothetical protein
MKRADIDRYLDETRQVEGWFFPIDVSLFGAVDELQKAARITGDLFEIGVHHGKAAVFLARALAAGETLGVCDLFEQQELDEDGYRDASRDVFLKNMRTLGNLPDSRLRVFGKPSETLTIEDTTSRCPLFSHRWRPHCGETFLRTCARLNARCCRTASWPWTTFLIRRGRG